LKNPLLKKKKINVAHFIGSLGGGGAEQQVVQLVNHLDTTIFEKHVIVFWDKTDGFKDRLDQNVLYYSLQYRRRFFPVGIFKLMRFLKNHGIDILHSHMYDPNKIGALMGKMNRVPVIVTSEHGRNPWKKWRHHIVEKHLINRAVDIRVAVSNDIRQRRIKYDGVKPDDIVVIPNGVVPPNYSKNNSPIPKVIGSMGRLVDAKDYPSLFKSVKLVNEKGYNLKLKVAGSGPLKDMLLNLIHNLDMDDNIDLVGFQKPEEFLETIDIFAMASVWEGMPVALLEAMSYGLPVVCTKVGGIIEVINDWKDGLLSQPKEPHQLMENIIKIIEDKELRSRLGENAKNKILKQYDIKKISETYGNLYIELLKNKGIKHVA